MVNYSKTLTKKLQYLSELPETNFPFISMYLNVNAHELFEQNRKNKIFIKNFIQKNENLLHKEGHKKKLESFRKDAEKIQYFLENNVISKAHGLAIFACDELGIFETFHSIMPFENSFDVNSIPHLKQLALHADECENALVIMTDKHASRFFDIKLGGYIVNETDMEHKIHRFHKQGGWAQMRYQRHIKNQALHHYKEVAKAATEFLDAKKYENVILIGQHHEIKKLQDLLPKRVKMKIIDINVLDMRENINHIFETIIEDLNYNEAKKELNCVEDIINKAPRNSATGLQDTIKLIEEGRAELVVIPGYKTYKGYKCNGCLYVTKDQHQAGCPFCNSHSRETDLIEEVIRLAFKHSGKVELIKNEAAEKLENYEGIGALIRY